MKQPTDQQERNEDKKKPEKENPSRGIDPESKEPEMETDQDTGDRQKENQNQQKKGPLAAWAFTSRAKRGIAIPPKVLGNSGITICFKAR